jgi:ribonuclease HI
MVTLFFDGAEKTFGFILNNQPYSHTHEGKVGTVQSEAIALLFGLRKAKELGFTKLNIIGDSRVVVDMALGVARVRGPRLRSIFFEIKGYLDSLDDFKINWVPRVLNSADKISR